MKTIIAALFFCTPFVLFAQQDEFTRLRDQIVRKVECCSIVFSEKDQVKVSSVTVDRKGNVTLSYSGQKKPARFNLTQLYRDDLSQSGIETGSGKTQLLIFHLHGELSKVIRFKSYEETMEAYRAFHKLYDLLLQENATVKEAAVPADKPEDGSIFIHRLSNLSHASEFLRNSLRAIDKKDTGTTTIAVMNRGEGWLTKDSVPTGIWKFYAKKQNGEEYLFKYGKYELTDEKSFDIKVHDSVSLYDQHGISTRSLREERRASVPFVKSGKWIYLHENGKEWKQVKFQRDEIPVYLDEVITTDGAGNQTGTSFLMRLKTDPDEWILSEVKEYDAKGQLFKVLQYYAFSEVYKKKTYRSGEIIREETAQPYQTTVLPTQYQ